MREEYIRDFGTDLGELLTFAYQDWVEAAYTWQELSELVKTEGRVKLLRAVSSEAFDTITKCMIDSVVLAICRLTDPAGTGERTNISLLHLKTDNKRYSNLKEDLRLKLTGLDSLIEGALESAEPLRILRHKLIAHSDSIVNGRLRAGEYEPVSLDQIKIALDGIHSVFAYISDHLQGKTLGNQLREEVGGMSTLLYYLARGHVMQERMFTPGFESNQEIEDEIQAIINKDAR